MDKNKFRAMPRVTSDIIHRVQSFTAQNHDKLDHDINTFLGFLGDQEEYTAVVRDIKFSATMEGTLTVLYAQVQYIYLDDCADC